MTKTPDISSTWDGKKCKCRKYVLIWPLYVLICSLYIWMIKALLRSATMHKELSVGFLKEQFPSILFNQTICILNFSYYYFFKINSTLVVEVNVTFTTLYWPPCSWESFSWENNVSSNIKFLSVLALEIDISSTRKSFLLLFSYFFSTHLKQHHLMEHYLVGWLKSEFFNYK